MSRIRITMTLDFGDEDVGINEILDDFKDVIIDESGAEIEEFSVKILKY